MNADQSSRKSDEDTAAQASRRMKVGIHLPQFGRAAGPRAIAEAAQLAEDLGFADVWVSDHIVHPAAQSYPSPYLFDALTCLTWAGASTERIGLGTSVLVVPMHEPLALANTLASLDALSGGRVVVGAGVGWSQAEYSAVGQQFADRGRRMDEALDLMRAAWSEDPVTFHGRYSDFEDIRVLPKPAHQIEIWIGGQSPAAFRRAVERGDGYQALGRSPDEAAELVARIRKDRPEPTFTISARTGWDPQGMDRGRIRAERDQFEEVGIQHMVAAPWQSDQTAWLRSMELLADLVLPADSNRVRDDEERQSSTP